MTQDDCYALSNDFARRIYASAGDLDEESVADALAAAMSGVLMASVALSKSKGQAMGLLSAAKQAVEDCGTTMLPRYGAVQAEAVAICSRGFERRGEKV